MGIVFDEVVGEVMEPGATAEAAEPAAEEPEATSLPLEMIRRYLRLLEQREARLYAD